jgi:hypothetical protein
MFSPTEGTITVFNFLKSSNSFVKGKNTFKLNNWKTFLSWNSFEIESIEFANTSDVSYIMQNASESDI